MKKTKEIAREIFPLSLAACLLELGNGLLRKKDIYII
jgi:hypothetical protein